MARRKAARRAGRRRSYGRKSIRRSAQKVPLIMAGALAIPNVMNAYTGYKASGATGAMNNLTYGLTGYDMNTGKWEPQNARAGQIALGATAVCIVGRKFGLNKYNPFKKYFRIF